jgi:hypothetical protein
MDPARQKLWETIRIPFDAEDIAEAVRSPTVLESLHQVFDPLVTDDFVTEMVADSSFRTERVGIEGFLEAWRDWAGAWERLRIEVAEVIEIPNGLYTEVEQTGVPLRGTTEMSQRAAAVWMLEGDLLSRVEFHLDPETARRSAGLGS